MLVVLTLNLLCLFFSHSLIVREFLHTRVSAWIRDGRVISADWIARSVTLGMRSLTTREVISISRYFGFSPIRAVSKMAGSMSKHQQIPGYLWALVFSHRFPLPKMGAYRLSTSVKFKLDFWKCTSMHFLSLIGTFNTLKVIEVFPDGCTMEYAWWCTMLKYSQALHHSPYSLWF